jgi:hypothetical protein
MWVLFLLVFGSLWFGGLMFMRIKTQMDSFNNANDIDLCYSCEHPKSEHSEYGECPEGNETCECEYFPCDCGIDGFWK